MPHAIFNLGSLSASQEASPRTLVPGVEPGGQKAGRDFKPALLIQDCWVEPVSLAQGATITWESMTYSLKLSQEFDMTPGLELPIAVIGSERAQADATGTITAGAEALIKEMFHAQGTVWAPRFVGVRVVESGSITGYDVDVHLDYERIEVPWMDWFLMWDFLDNVVDNQRDY